MSVIDVFPKPNGDQISKAVAKGLPTEAGKRTTLGVHGLVLLVFHGRYVTLLLPKEGAPGRTHNPFVRVFSPDGTRAVDLVGAHWSTAKAVGGAPATRRVSTRTRLNTTHPLTPVERILDMADVVGAKPMLPPLRELVAGQLLNCSITLTGVEVSAHLPYSPFGWLFLWQAGKAEVLCTDTAFVTFRSSKRLVLHGTDYVTGDARRIDTAARERFAFVGNLDTDDFEGTPSFTLGETAGYAKLYGEGAARRAAIPFASRTFGGEILHDQECRKGFADRAAAMNFTILSSSSSGECNLAADYYDAWDSRLS